MALVLSFVSTWRLQCHEHPYLKPAAHNACFPIELLEC